MKGQVLNEQGDPLPKATIFINTTCIGTGASEQGKFELKLPIGRSSIVVASEGFETQSEIVNAIALPAQFTIKLKKRAVQKSNSTTRNRWLDWGEFFMTSFIGSSANAKECKIKNTKAVHFYISEERNEVSASTDEPLTIENEALGYTIKYYLESFVFNFNTHLFSYKGYSFFRPMDGNSHRQKTWETNRSEAYFGSMMHFMRSVYRNQIAEEGFDLRPLKKVKNIPSFQPSQSDSTNKAGDTTTVGVNEEEDYEDQVLNEDNYRDMIGPTIPGDSVAYAINKTTAALEFNNFLLVTYRKKEAPIEYQEQMSGTGMTSQLILINKRHVEIEWNGSYYDTGDLLTMGYWMWAQKIANILPYDYMPPKTP